MNVCGYCGCVVVGEGVMPVEQMPIIVGSSDGSEFEGSEGFSVSFCSEGCAWAFSIESHSLYGMSGKVARRHLIDEHGLMPGKPAGKMSQECFERFKKIAEVFSGFAEGGPQAVKFRDS